MLIDWWRFALAKVNYRVCIRPSLSIPTLYIDTKHHSFESLGCRCWHVKMFDPWLYRWFRPKLFRLLCLAKSLLSYNFLCCYRCSGSLYFSRHCCCFPILFLFFFLLFCCKTFGCKFDFDFVEIVAFVLIGLLYCFQGTLRQSFDVWPHSAHPFWK